jgi:prepilin-type N-terminal cleavage/methylation domain-containing protein/prepilin-type processing-associated H-X9-DG protein
MTRGFTLTELAVVVVLGAVLFVILYPVFVRPHGGSRQNACVNNQKQIVTAMHMYCEDHQESLPTTAAFWTTVNVDLGVLKCPTAKKRANGYGFNTHIGGKKLGDFDKVDAVLVTADSDAPTNQLIVPADVAMRHTQKCVASFLDGHVELITSERVSLQPTLVKKKK